jgi:hypothetical protein
MLGHVKNVSQISSDSRRNEVAAEEVSDELVQSIKANPTDDSIINQGKQHFYMVLLQKVRYVKLLCCSRFATVKFHGDSKAVNKFEKLWKFFLM